MDANVLVGLLRLDLECRGFAETTIREYTRLAGKFPRLHVVIFTSDPEALLSEPAATEVARGYSQSD